VESLSESSANLFNFLPTAIQESLIAKRDQHGNVQLVKSKLTKVTN
jgi:hypothetical protein